ncbi:YjiH family protein [Anaerofustis stercorihominis]|uniref:YjiH family protein n=1 Tax=Anaerofustis stercorihominis TaxID=214853 RepID=UPI00398402ED
MENNTTTKVVYDPDMPSNELDNITFKKDKFLKSLIRLIICSVIGILVFFVSVPHNGDSEIIFSIVYNWLIGLMGNFAYWVIALIVGGNLFAHIYYKYIKKGKCTSTFAGVYENDTIFHTILYSLGFIYVFLYAMKMNIAGFVGPEFIVGDATGGSVVPPIVLGVLGIIIVGAVFMPFLLNYGILEIVGALLEPFMRPLFKVPGKAALDAVASFVSSSSLGVLITNRLWKKNAYTDKEMVAIMTGFSAVSIGFAYLVINTANLGHLFLKIYAISFVLVFIMEIIMVRIPPISRKKNVYYNGREQSEAERKDGAKASLSIFKTGFSRAVKRAGIANGVATDIKLSVMDSLLILPQVLTMLSAIGVSALILAEYTPVFQWLGNIFKPLLLICQVPDVSLIAPSIPVGIAEMFLPVLVMGTKITLISEPARVFVTLVSIVQIIFFSETATVMLATKSPIKFWEIIVCFLERTVIAIPLAAIVIHLFF